MIALLQDDALIGALAELLKNGGGNFLGAVAALFGVWKLAIEPLAHRLLDMLSRALDKLAERVDQVEDRVERVEVRVEDLTRTKGGA